MTGDMDPWPIGFTLDFTERSQIKFGGGGRFIIDTVSIVKTSPTAQPPKSFYVTRYMPDCVVPWLGGERDLVPIRLLEVPVWKNRFAPTHKVEWHFALNEPINLGFGQDGRNCLSDGYKLHLTGKAFYKMQLYDVHISSSDVTFSDDLTIPQKCLKSFGMTLELDADRETRKFDRDIVVQSVTVVPENRSFWFLSTKDVSVIRFMKDERQESETRLHLLTITSTEDSHKTTSTVKWHFKKNQPINLQFIREYNGYSQNPGPAQLHLTGVFIPEPYDL